MCGVLDWKRFAMLVVSDQIGSSHEPSTGIDSLAILAGQHA